MGGLLKPSAQHTAVIKKQLEQLLCQYSTRNLKFMILVTSTSRSCYPPPPPPLNLAPDRRPAPGPLRFNPACTSDAQEQRSSYFGNGLVGHLG